MFVVFIQVFFSHVFFSWLLLFLGDFLSTFCYHVPEYVFGKLHLQTHHAPRKTFHHYAVLAPEFNVLLDGLLGDLPFFFDPNFDAEIQPIQLQQHLPDDKEHRWDKTSVHDVQGTYGDYVLGKVAKVFPELQRAVHQDHH